MALDSFDSALSSLTRIDTNETTNSFHSHSRTTRIYYGLEQITTAGKSDLCKRLSIQMVDTNEEN
ncbi:hypothetical protein H6G97_46355 [Nostoc flagelliforme FACHB-838]|uniref:Uncharacterized protein n=1 Tax=Nostoc flagelliforme FACHB-838 TaxID=2692904 RepID=A0ABR8E4D8_9NOSO|nr:hypothetical protein [Nostoc flagelliforme FACHB-838]